MSFRQIVASSARFVRQLAGASLLLVAGRFAWLAVSDAAAAGADEAKAALHDGMENQQDDLLKDADAINAHRPDLKKLKEIMEGEQDVNLASQPQLPEIVLRRLVVTEGPDRAEVFVQGRRVGQVPYIGQVHCRAGEEVRVQLLPAKGLPITRTAYCSGPKKDPTSPEPPKDLRFETMKLLDQADQAKEQARQP